MTIDENGLISWIPASTDVGIHIIVVSVTDSGGLIDTQEYELEVESTGECGFSWSETSVTNTEFKDPAIWTRYGDAANISGTTKKRLQLTDGLSQASSAFFHAPVSIEDAQGAPADLSFSFSYRMHGRNGFSESDGVGADGIVFLLADAAAAPGTNGGYLGYDAFPNSVAVEIDTWQNEWDLNGNHIGINHQGKLESLKQKEINYKLNNDAWRYVWIDYIASSKKLEVRIAKKDVRPNNHTLRRTVDILGNIGSSSAFIGFLSSTGASAQVHDIKNVSFTGQMYSESDDCTDELVEITSVPPTDALVGTPVSYTVVGTSSFPDSALSYSLTNAPDGAQIDAVTGELTWLPSSVGTTSITVVVTSSTGITVEQSFDISVSNAINLPPVAIEQSVVAVEDTAQNILLTGSDPEGSALIFTLVVEPEYGVLTGVIPDLVYTPLSNYSGPDSFSFTVSDGALSSSTAVVGITVSAVNDIPVATSLALTTNEATPVAFVLSGTDIDNDDLSFVIESTTANGTLSGTAPNLVYTPDANFDGTDEFSYSVSDGTNVSELAVVTFSVSSVNDAPTVQALAFSGDEDSDISVPLVGSDADGDTLSYLVVQGPANGTLTGTAPQLVYTPDPNFNGTDSLTYQANDGVFDSNIATVSLVVAPVNDLPLVTAQSLSTAENVAIAIELSATDIDGDQLTYEVVGAPANGVLSGTAPNVTYTPNSGYAGTDSFTYRAFDGVAYSETVLVSLSISDVNVGPIAAAADIAATEDAPITIALSGSDDDGDTLSYVIASQPTNGTLTGTAPNLTYTPNADFNGADEFTFTVSDGVLNSAPAAISITVANVNDAPVAVAQVLSTPENVTVDVDLEAADVDGDVLSFEVVTDPTNGILTGIAPNITYMPNTGYSGADSFEFRAFDGVAYSETVVVTVSISDVNVAPVAAAAEVAATEDESSTFILDATDGDGDALSYVIASQPTNGTLSGAAPELNYTPNADFNGTDEFTFTVNDGVLDSAVATISISVDAINDLPVVVAQSVSTAENSAVEIELLATDVDNDILTFEIVTDPTNGVLTGTSPNFTFEPNANFAGTDSFEFRAFDGVAYSEVATVSVSISDVNVGPVAEAAEVVATEDESITITLAGTDGDGDTLSYVVVSQPTNGTLTGTAPELTYTPNADFYGTDEFTFQVNDGVLDSAAATISVDVESVNDAPVASIQSVILPQNESIVLVLAGIDVEDDVLTFEVTTEPTNGVLTGTAPNLTYTPNDNYAGSDSVEFRVNDGTDDSEIAVVSIEVTDVNQQPVVESSAISTAEDTAVAISLIATDADADLLTYAINIDPVNGVLTGTAPDLTYTPNAGYTGTDEFSFTVNDGELDSTVALISITIDAAPNTAPIANAGVDLDAIVGVAVTLDGSLSNDPDSDTLTYLWSIESAPDGSQSSFDDATLINPVFSANAVGDYVIALIVDDGDLASAADEMTVSIATDVVNTAPVITSAAPDRINIGETLSYQVEATDAENDVLIYQLLGAPVGATINSSTGVLTWAPSLSDEGEAVFEIQVSDGLLTGTQIFTLTVFAKQSPVTLDGREFWVMFNDNSQSSVRADLYLTSTADHSITVTFPEGGEVLVLNGVADQVHVINVNDYMDPVPELNAIGNKAIHIESEQLISVYGINDYFNGGKSTDAFTAVPVTALGTEYVVMSYESSKSGFSSTGSLFSIIATQDNTSVSIVAPDDMRYKDPAIEGDAEWLPIFPGEQLQLTLQQGQTIEIQAETGIGDYTGTRILSDKKIAVFSGHKCTRIPAATNACDHIVEQLVPVSAFGTYFLTAPLALRVGGDLFRVVAAFDETEVRLNGVPVAFLGAGEFHELEMMEPSVIETSRPSQVAQFSKSAEGDTAPGRLMPRFYADPFMVTVPPVEHYLENYTVLISHTETEYDLINLITADWAIPELRINDELVDQSLFVGIGTTGYSTAQVPVGKGKQIINGVAPVGATVYGFGYYVSYGLLAGVGLGNTNDLASVALSTVESAFVGAQACVSGQVLDTSGNPAAHSPVDAVFSLNQQSKRQYSDVYGEFEICLVGAFIGLESVTVSVDTLSISTDINWLANPTAANLPPIFTTVPASAKFESAETFLYSFNANDPNGDTVSYSLISADPTITLDAASKTIVWNSPDKTIGEQTITLVASDNRGGETSQVIPLLVEQTNLSPFDITIDRYRFIAGRSNVFTISADDEYFGNPFIYMSGMPALRNYNTRSGYGVLDPVESDIGFHTISIVTSDSVGGITSKDIEIEIRAENTLPVFVSTHDRAAPLGEKYVYTPDVFDADGDVLTYSFSYVPPSLTVQPTIDPVTGVFEWQIDGAVPGVTIAVTDGFGTIKQDIYLDLVNEPPMIVDEPPAIAIVGETFEWYPQIVDPEGLSDTFVITTNSLASQGPGSYGDRLLWNPSALYIGIVTYEVTVRDRQGARATYSYDLEVRAANTGPTITSVPSGEAYVDSLYSYEVIAVDPDNDTITLTLDSGPAGAVLENGVLMWTPTSAQVGPQTITVSASDGAATVTQEFTLTVLDEVEPNNPPVFENAPGQLAIAGREYSYTAEVSDIDGDMVTLATDQAPTGMQLFGNTITWTALPEQAGITNIVLIASDGEGAEVTLQFDLQVRAENIAPTITSNPILTAYPDREWVYDVITFDGDGDDVTLALVDAPDGMTLTNGNEIRWTPVAAQIGEYFFQISATDAFDEVIQGVTLEVREYVNEAPVITSAPETDLTVDQLWEYIIVANDPNGEAITITLENAPAGMVLDTTTNTVSWTPTAADLGAVQGTIVVSDGELEATQTFDLTVRTDDGGPIVTLRNPEYLATVTAPVNVGGSVDDVDLVSWQLVLQRDGRTELTELASGTSAFDSDGFAVFDPTLLINGIYTLAMIAEDAAGNTTTEGTRVIVDGNLKVGNFSITFNDLSIPMLGIPIEVNRTYDSRRRSEDLDFGYGWTIDYQNVEVTESRTLGIGWEYVENTEGVIFGDPPEFCVQPLGTPTVTVRLPDDTLEEFDVALEEACHVVPVLDGRIVFKPKSGTTSELTSLESTLGRITVATGEFGPLGGSGPIDPNRYELTTKAGYVYVLNQEFGIETITDPNGHVLTYSDSGISHSAGKSIEFVRDATGRITEITDPSGNIITYNYDSANDLIAVTDREFATTDFTYNNNHGLVDIIDPLGRRIVRNMYDDDGRLTGQEDNEGNVTNFNHNLSGRESIITDRLGRITALYYDERGNVTSKVDALGRTYTYTYDEFDNQLTETNPLGHTTSATFDDRYNQLSQTDGLGNTVTYAYNTLGQETLITDARGNSFNNTYDPVGNLLTVTDPLGNVAGQNINSKGLVSLRRDAENNDTLFEYDDEGNVTKETDAEGGITTYTYDANNNRLTESRTRTVNNVATIDTTTYEYNSRDQQTKTTDALGNVTQTEYDQLGREVAQIDAKGRRTTMVYDNYGRLTATTYPDGTSDSSTYDLEGNKLTDTNRLGRTMTYTIDALNRVVSTLYPGNVSTSSVYDEAGRMVSETDERGNTRTQTYDAANRRIASVDALGNTMGYSYDVDGNMTTQTDARSNTTTYTYNALDQRVLTTFADSTTMSSAFDKRGLEVSKTDQNGRATGFDYDGLGRLVSVTDALNQVTQYGYDEVGNKLTQTDALGRVTAWAYDAINRPVSRTLPLGQQETYAYDTVGNRTSHTDFNGAVHAFVYDPNNDWLLNENWANGNSTAYAYNAIGQRTSATDTNGSYTYGYDNRDRLTNEIKHDGSELVYGYDDAGNRTTLSTVVSGITNTATYTFDALNRMASVTDNDGNTTSYAFDANSNQTRIDQANNTATNMSFDDLNRVTTITHLGTAGETLTSLTYSLDDTGRRTAINESTGRSSNYTYDELYRLTGETITDNEVGNHSASYNYNAVSNRVADTVNGTSSNYTYDDNDRITAHGQDSYSYDDNGNTIAEVVDGQSNSYTYDSQNRLIEANMGGVVQAMAYDPDGVRIQKSSNGDTTDYLTDSNRDYAQVLYERSATSELNYTFGTDLVGLSTRVENFTYHSDALGSTRLLTDTSGSVADDVRYDAWGEVLSGGDVLDNQYLYTGEQFDSGLGKTYLRARYYDAGVGRFSQMDVFSGYPRNAITLNKYLYGDAQPTNMIDPSGKFSLMSLGAASRGLSAMLTSASSAGTTLLGQAAGATIRLSRGIGSKLALRYIKQCIKKKDKCRIKLNMLIVGNDVPTMVDHIRKAQMSSPRTFRLTWDFKNKGKKHKRWYYKKGSYLGGCGAVAKPSSTANCDEYPMQKTTQGGELKYNSGRVSLEWVDGRENSYVGSHFGGMTGKMKKNNNYNFFVITTQSIPTVGLVFGKKKGK